MKDEIAYFCPQCQGMELELQPNFLIGAGPSVAKCKLCRWQGGSDQLIGALNPENEKFWTAERIANVLLAVSTKHAAGPLVQVLELLGLVPAVKGSLEEQRSAEAVREGVMKAVLEGVIVGAFETSALLSPAHFAKYDPDKGRAADRLFNEEPGDEPS
jgi:hypothetical protein